jgi:predicted phage terminase large subunit-like protein
MEKKKLNQTEKQQKRNNDIPVDQIVQSEVFKEYAESILAEKSLLDFTMQAWKIIEPGVEFKDNWHLHYLEEELLLLVVDDIEELLLEEYPQDYIDYLKSEKFGARVNINIPPRTMKSLFINVFFPCWVWIHNPAKKIITVSYAKDLSMSLNQKRREIIESAWYQKHWGDRISLKDEQNTKTSFENTRQGLMFSTSIGGTLTGKGGDIILLDDLQNPKQAESEADRKRAINFFRQTLPTRLNDFERGVIVNIQQRLHYNDVSGFILSNYDHYKTIVLPSETTEDRFYVAPISQKTYTFKKGTVLWQNRMPASWIKTIKKEQGSRTYNAQFLQDPTPPGGFLINTSWLRRWHNLPIFNTELMAKRKDKYKIIMAWDMNFKKKVGADNVACSVFLTDFVTSYLVDKYEEQIGFIETLEAVTQMKEKWEFIISKENVKVPIEIIIEDKANGPAIMEVLQLKIPGIIPITPVEDKVTRMTSITTFLEAGNVLVPSLDTSAALIKHSWLPDALEELAKFPNVTHDDFSDSFSIGLRRIYVEPPIKRKPMQVF